MQGRGGKLIRMLAVAAAAAMSVSALPASVTTAAQDAECKVHNLNKGTDRGSLQRAVRLADPGDALLVQGTCTGTTLIDKELDLSYMGWSGAPMPLGEQYVASPRGRIVSDGLKPALVIDPGVDRLTVNSGLAVVGGVVVDELVGWRAGPDKLPAKWRTATPSITASTLSSSLSDCHLRNADTGDEFQHGQAAVDVAAPGQMLSLRGSCAGTTRIDKPARMAGWRIALSSMSFDGSAASAEDSGPATLAQVRVDDDVDSLVLRDVRVSNGFRIAELGP